MKKQLRRVFPKIFNHSKHEKIIVQQSSHGVENIALNGNQSFPHINNLFITNSKCHQARHLAGAILQARLIDAVLSPSMSTVEVKEMALAETNPPSSPQVELSL